MQRVEVSCEVRDIYITLVVKWLKFAKRGLNSFCIIKPTICTNFTNLFWHEILHVSDSSSVHHQEFIHCTLSNVICHKGLLTAFQHPSLTEP